MLKKLNGARDVTYSHGRQPWHRFHPQGIYSGQLSGWTWVCQVLSHGVATGNLHFLKYQYKTKNIKNLCFWGKCGHLYLPFSLPIIGPTLLSYIRPEHFKQLHHLSLIMEPPQKWSLTPGVSGSTHITATIQGYWGHRIRCQAAEDCPPCLSAPPDHLLSWCSLQRLHTGKVRIRCFSGLPGSWGPHQAYPAHFWAARHWLVCSCLVCTNPGTRYSEQRNSRWGGAEVGEPWLE